MNPIAEATGVLEAALRELLAARDPDARAVAGQVALRALADLGGEIRRFATPARAKTVDVTERKRDVWSALREDRARGGRRMR